MDQRSIIELDPTRPESVAAAITQAKAIQAHHQGGRAPRFYFAPEFAGDSRWEFAKFSAKLCAVGALFAVVASGGALVAGALRLAGFLGNWAGDVFDAASACPPDCGEDHGCLNGEWSAMGRAANRCHAWAAKCQLLAGVTRRG
jgi:hypothetical protein